MIYIDINDQIKAFAKSKRIKPEDFPAFRDKILNGLRVLKLSTTEINVEKYKEIAKKYGGEIDGTKKV